MLCPEVWNFEAPNSTFKFQKVDNSENLLSNPIVNKFYYNHLVSVILPDSLRLPGNLTENFFFDSEYYKVYDLNPSDLLNINFLKLFVKSGKVTLLTVNRRIDCDNCISITPLGQLILSIDKETFQSLGVQAKVSHFTQKHKDRYLVKIDLKEDFLDQGKSKYEKLKSNLQTLGNFTVIISWEPSKQDVCPSSVAKYFSDLGYTVNVSFPKFTSSTLYSVKVPEVPLTTDAEENVTDFVEWLGMISLECDVETNDPANYLTSFVTPEPNNDFGQVKLLRWRGFFTVTKIKELINDLMEYVASLNKPWISVYVQGFSDSPVSWGCNEHHYYTNGDNAYLIIFNEGKYMLCTQQCSKKQYKNK